MDIIWELLIILHANVIVCISGESWASLAPFWAGTIIKQLKWVTRCKIRNLNSTSTVKQFKAEGCEAG
uniref:Uncharacterized protein n=1 Tax=Poecilia mexicana TaxID=48701 RepID=A0A3B3WQ12_9TELE